MQLSLLWLIKQTIR